MMGLDFMSENSRNPGFRGPLKPSFNDLVLFDDFHRKDLARLRVDAFLNHSVSTGAQQALHLELRQ